MQTIVLRALRESIETKQKILENGELVNSIVVIANVFVETFKGGGKVLICGNGGSAADAQHIAAELSGKFHIKRAPLFAEALHVNTSAITAIANDLSFKEVFVRLVGAFGARNDILLAISTSGISPNVLRAIDYANRIGMITVGLTGGDGGKMKKLCKHLVVVPCSDTPRIQEAHITIGHILCEIVEERLFGDDGQGSSNSGRRLRHKA